LNSFNPSGDKTENLNNYVLSFVTAIKLIPYFNREYDHELYPFIACEFAISRIKETGVPVLVYVLNLVVKHLRSFKIEEFQIGRV